jgi:uncharacterized membrane protein
VVHRGPRRLVSLFILMSQNRSGAQADQRNHLDLQINLLSGDENTKMLQMLQALCVHHNLNIAEDPRLESIGWSDQDGRALRLIKAATVRT